ncbi:GNAT family N-acetyltransferase [Saliniramus sp.]|uniref:GNAT family N-acetyltransferase n=1 Tax=Saliniramus sp. TaxID=2986772 RepID=UPI002BEF95AE|nr:GNAT family N-acetyltransferase [Saliniramus sp.]HMB09164.1 GNAT family N-acetyltransferase [Saliniramus sp.]
MTNPPEPPASGFSLMRIEAAAMSDALDDLAGILHACVSDGAAVSFILPFARDDARAFWRDSVLPQVEAGATILLAARDETDGRLVGTVQLGIDTPPNQPHRADLKKLLVHPRARRRGIARALITRLEGEAQACGRSMITLDTRTGDMAEPLYRAMGYEEAGVIPDYSLDVTGTRLEATTVFYKRLNGK